MYDMYRTVLNILISCNTVLPLESRMKGLKRGVRIGGEIGGLLCKFIFSFQGSIQIPSGYPSRLRGPRS